MTRSIAIFTLGIIFACALLAIWDFYHRHQIGQRLHEAQAISNRALRAVDLVGRWKGKESRGTTFVITRHADGTFSEVTNFEQADVPHTPSIVSSEGRYFLVGPYYGRYYTKSSEPSWTEREPMIFAIQTFTPTELTYFVEEGDGCREVKQ
jgi:hypothetical protein